MDMVSLNIAGGILASICRDMGVTLMRTSYSTIFTKSLDFTCALALPSGEMIATGDFCPAMIGGMPLLITILRERNRRRGPRGGRRHPAQRSLSRRPAHARAHLLQAGFRRRRPDRLLRRHRPCLRGRRHVAGRICRRGDRSLPRRSARAAGQDQEGRQGCRRDLAHPARQCAHAPPQHGRLPRLDRRHRSRRAPHGAARAQIRNEELPRDRRAR